MEEAQQKSMCLLIYQETNRLRCSVRLTPITEALETTELGLAPAREAMELKRELVALAGWLHRGKRTRAIGLMSEAAALAARAAPRVSREPQAATTRSRDLETAAAAAVRAPQAQVVRVAQPCVAVAAAVVVKAPQALAVLVAQPSAVAVAAVAARVRLPAARVALAALASCACARFASDKPCHSN